MLKYEVDDINVVLPDQTRDLYVVQGKDYMTLLTCTPYALSTHRLLVRGERVPYEKPDDGKTVINESSAYTQGFVYILGYKVSYTAMTVAIVGFVLFVVVVVFLIIRVRKHGKSKKKGE